MYSLSFKKTDKQTALYKYKAALTEGIWYAITQGNPSLGTNVVHSGITILLLATYYLF